MEKKSPIINDMTGSRRGSCTTDFFQTDYTEEKPKTETGLEHVPEEKIKAMQAYAKLLRKKFPHMKPDRLKRKVAEHFKIKLT